MPFDPNQAALLQQGGQPPQGGMPPGGMPGMDPSQGMGQDPSMDPNAQQDPQMGAGGPPPGPPPPPQPDPQQQSRNALNAAIQEMNLAKKVDDEEKDKIGALVVEGYDTDLESCQGWLDNNKLWLQMALLARKNKVTPWPRASNVKFPLLSTAAMQFSARAYPTLVPADNKIVKSRVVGYDPTGELGVKADRIATHMSYQIMYKMPDWEEDMDRLLMIEAISGLVFKKTYKDPVTKYVCSKLVNPEDLIVNYWAKSVESAYRKTEVLLFTENEYQSKVRGGEFLDLGELTVSSNVNVPSQDKPRANEEDHPATVDAATPHVFLAQHTYYDLDGDGYEEPVVIVVHKDTKKVARIVARFNADSFKYNDKQKVTYIEPIEYFTDFQFIPNPDGSIYGLGFGSLLGPINESVNTLVNQLIDSGTLNNLQSGFIGKGLRIQMKETKFLPGEWKAVNATGDDLHKSIFPIPTKEPSGVLLQLMNILIQSGNQLASVAEIFVGKMPGQNTPATTTQETVDQAMKVFMAIYKRNYRALMREFRKIYRINRYSPEIVAEEAALLKMDLQVSDYDGPEDYIIPAADPSGSSQTMQFQQLQNIGQTLLPMGVINTQEFAMRSLKLSQISDPEKLLAPPAPPPPDPKAQTEQLKQQGMQQKAQLDQQASQQEMAAKDKLFQLEAAMHQMKLQYEQQMQAMKLDGERSKAHTNLVADQAKAHLEGQIAIMKQGIELAQNERDTAHERRLQMQELAHNQASHQADLAHTKAKAKAAPKPKGN